MHREDERLDKAERDARVAEPEQAEAKPAKNFTVDDEIEARQAAFEKVVDEYNAQADAPDADKDNAADVTGGKSGG
jgi:hypothetical protein